MDTRRLKLWRLERHERNSKSQFEKLKVSAPNTTVAKLKLEFSDSKINTVILNINAYTYEKSK